MTIDGELRRPTVAEAGGTYMDDGLRRVQSRACAAWPLPGDPTCAGVARRLFRQVASGLALEPEIIDDGVTMVSELAANTLHAAQDLAASVHPELWLYLRGTGSRAELVCKVFDTLPGWAHGNVPGRTIRRAPADAMSGRGLEVVHELSAGHWGHHLSRARLACPVFGQPGLGQQDLGQQDLGQPGFGQQDFRPQDLGFPGLDRPGPVAAGPDLAWPGPADGVHADHVHADHVHADHAHAVRDPLEPAGVDGKAVWFALPAPAADTLPGLPPVEPGPATAAEAVSVLEQDLGTRGLDGTVVRADDAGANMAVLSIAGGLAVWCRGGVAWLRAPGIPVQPRGYRDLVEVAEQAVQAYELSVAIADSLPLVDATRTGS